MSFGSWFRSLFHKQTAVQPPMIDVTKVAPAPTPVPVQAQPEVAQPTPAPVVAQAPAPYTGPYRDINGNPDPLGQYQEYNWRAARAQAMSSYSVNAGPIPIESITSWGAGTSDWTDEIRDSDYLWACNNKNTGIWFKVCGGSTVDINRKINESEFHFNWLAQKGVDFSKYTGQVSKYVKFTKL